MVCRCLILHQSHAVMISLLRILVYPVLSFDSWAKSVSKNAQNTKKTSKGKTEKLHVAAINLINLSRLTQKQTKTKSKKLKAINFKKYVCFLLYIYSPLEMKCIERKN